MGVSERDGAVPLLRADRRLGGEARQHLHGAVPGGAQSAGPRQGAGAGRDGDPRAGAERTDRDLLDGRRVQGPERRLDQLHGGDRPRLGES